MDPQQNLEIADIIYLISRYSLGELNYSELKQLEEWKAESESNLLLFNQVMDENERRYAVNEMRSYDSKRSYESIQKRKEAILKNRNSRKLWYSGIAASFVFLAGISLTLYFMNFNDKQLPAVIQTKIQVDAGPGTNKAILILSDGSRVKLSQVSTGLMAKQSGIDIMANSGRLVYHDMGNRLRGGETLYNTIVTPKGGQYAVELPDGSKVTLNAESSLKYPLDFSGDFRQVSLKGEAYFEVRHDIRRPFKVSSGKQLITVLGTEFNVNSYADEGGIRSTLVRGSVQLDFTGGKNISKLLRPGEQAIQVQNSFVIMAVDVDVAIAWKQGKFSFENATIPQIMRQISRWYNVEVVYKGAIPGDTFTGAINRQSNLSTVLRIFKESQINFKLSDEGSGRKILTVITNTN